MQTECVFLALNKVNDHATMPAGLFRRTTALLRSLSGAVLTPPAAGRRESFRWIVGGGAINARDFAAHRTNVRAQLAAVMDCVE